MNEAIRVENVSVHYGEVHALDHVDLTLNSGSVCGLIGMNGSGKSTLFKVIMGMIKPDNGSVRIAGLDAAAARKSGRVGYVPQSEDVDWTFPISVRDVVMMGRYGHLGFLRRPRRADREAVAEALERVELTEFADRQIGQLGWSEEARLRRTRYRTGRVDTVAGRAFCRRRQAFRGNDFDAATRVGFRRPIDLGLDSRPPRRAETLRRGGTAHAQGSGARRPGHRASTGKPRPGFRSRRDGQDLIDEPRRTAT